MFVYAHVCAILSQRPEEGVTDPGVIGSCGLSSLGAGN